MGNKTDATMTEVAPYKLKLKPRECEICGGKYIPTGTKQRFCPACAAGRKHNPKYTAARTPGEVKIIIPKQTDVGSGGNGCKEAIETPEETMQQTEAPEKITRQVIETPETGTWYEVRVRKDGAVMMDAKISPEMLAMIIREVR